MAQGETRTETDSMGPVEVPAARYWGAQTQRSLHHFAIGNDRMPKAVIRGMALLKKAAAMVNRDLGTLSNEHAQLIITAQTRVDEGHDVLVDDRATRPAPVPVVLGAAGAGEQHVRVLLPADQIGGAGVAPADPLVVEGLRVVLEEEVMTPVVMDQTVRVVHPAGGRGEVEQRHAELELLRK